MEWLLLLMGGLLGSAHCLGMCGPFAVMIGAGAANSRMMMMRQMLYSAGRIATYAFGGAAAGFIGMRLSRWFDPVGQIQGAVSILAGLFLVVQGLLFTGLVPIRRKSIGGSCGASSMLATFLRNPNSSQVFLAGILTGFLPCGLVYAYLSLAAASGSIWRGMGVMTAFGAGTVPMMVLAAYGARFATLTFRRRLFQIAAFCIILTGGYTIARGAWSLTSDSSDEARGCPACAEAEGNGQSWSWRILARTVADPVTAPR
ncbi:MAG: sulfite exporter TauE/SafE family protein [Planctomycetaceae bacterium]